MQDVLRDIFGPMFEAMLQGEMDSHPGYEANDRGAKSTSNRRNGYTDKTVKSSIGEIEIRTPRDRDGSFEPQLIPKRSKDVSGIEDKVLGMYAKGMSQRDIADAIKEIYEFEISHETISAITDRVIETARDWQKRPLMMKQRSCKSSMMIRSSDIVSLINPRKTAYPPVCQFDHPNVQPYVSIIF